MDIAGGAAAAVGVDDADDRVGYLEHSSSPLVSLAFVAPLVLVYELGTRTPLPAVGPEGHAASGGAQHVIAFSLLQQFFALFGATGRSLPAMALVGILLAWHVARQDRWRVRWQTLGAMAIESSLLSFPLLALSVLLAHLLRMVPLAASYAGHPALGMSKLTTDDLLILCLGAGIYEELVFRLIVLTILTLLVKDLLQCPGRFGTLLVVLISALMFSGYHYLGPEVFRWRTFAFRTLAGIYFGVLFLGRGFGVTAATHAAYDILVLLVLA
jgi:membrane protease YdiL (CAAX protease family)